MELAPSKVTRSESESSPRCVPLPFFFLIPFPKLFIAGAGGPPQSPPQQLPSR